MHAFKPSTQEAGEFPESQASLIFRVPGQPWLHNTEKPCLKNLTNRKPKSKQTTPHKTNKQIKQQQQKKPTTLQKSQP